MIKKNLALERIQQIKAKSGSGFGSSFEEIEPFVNPIIQQAAEEIKAEQRGPVEVLPPIEEDKDENRVAMRLIALQAEAIGTIAPTRTNVYNNTAGSVDLLISTLETMKKELKRN